MTFYSTSYNRHQWESLELFQSYFTGCTQQVSIDNVVSELAKLLYGVPQASVMGSIKYCIYTLPISYIIQSHGLNYSIYADETQVHLFLDENDSEAALHKTSTLFYLTYVFGC